MLKVERISKTDFSFKLKKKGPLLTPFFLKAFWIALGIHVFGLTLFGINCFTTQYAKSSTVSVLVDTSTQSTIFTNIENGSQKRNILEPPGSLPQISLSFPVEMIDAKQTIHPIPAKDHALEAYLSPVSNPPIEIIVSGNLMSRPFSHKDNDAVAALAEQDKVPCCRKYSIRIDEVTGQIFWYAPLQKGESPFDKIAERILQGMVFEAKPSLFVSSAEVEIRFNG